MRSIPRLVTGLLIVVLVAFHAEAAGKKKGREKENPDSAPIGEWLVLGPLPHPLPVFHDADEGGFDLEALLGAEVFPTASLAPRDGGSVTWFTGERRWEARRAEGGLLRLVAPGEGPASTWLATYLQTDRHRKVSLELTGSQPRRAWIDGKEVASGGLGSAEDEVQGDLELTPGHHLLVVQAVTDPERDVAWTLGAALAPPDSPEGEDTREDGTGVTPSLDPSRRIELRDVLDAPRVTSTAVAPDGSRVAISVSRVLPGTHDSESWLEIRRTDDGRVVDSWRGTTGAGRVAWSPDGSYLSFVAPTPGKGKQSSLFLYRTEERRVFPLLEGVEHFAGYRWSPTGRALVYSTTVEGEEFSGGVKRLEGLLDRWSDHRNRDYLNLVTVPDGMRRRLTAGGLDTGILDFSPDGTRLLFSRQVEALEARPYTRSELWELDLGDFTARKLRDFGWLNDASYAPDGRRLLIGGRPSEFGDAGINVADGRIPNSYDGQAFIWDPVDGSVRAITRGLDPAVRQAVWSKADGRIYIRAEDGDRIRLFSYDERVRSFEPVETGVDVLGSLSFADGAPRAVGTASGAWEHESLLSIDLATGAARRLPHPADDWFRDVEVGTVEDWSFRATTGRTIDGRVYLPPGFDPAGRYPLIVYYYGGTSPVNRGFGGRYPKEWWAANGYAVYVPQPSGATGYGQEFSSAHVNDWGKSTAREIIEGTERFLETHDWADRERVGCLGASYGGFMTMLLATETDLFAAAVAHAGISSISSYWGEGYWGFLYSAVATARSFPWNRRDIYVDQSPLFRADRAQVPILLTHGTSDRNVPPGESDQFYIALKLLGKEVEYVQVEGQDHWIVDHEKRQMWSSTILAWFDRWLKDDPAWWDALYD